MILTEKDEESIRVRALHANPYRLRRWIDDLLETVADLRNKCASVGIGKPVWAEKVGDTTKIGDVTWTSAGKMLPAKSVLGPEVEQIRGPAYGAIKADDSRD